MASIVRNRLLGMDVTLDKSISVGRTSTTHRSRSRSERDGSLDAGLQLPPPEPRPERASRLPPAVANVPKEDLRGYLHSKKVNHYFVGSTLGEGSFAKVKEAFHVLVGEKVAMKVVDKKKAMQDPYVARNFKREAKLLQKVRHPNIVQLYEIIETENNYYLITELCTGGDLMKHIYKYGHLSEAETRKYIQQIVSAIDHLHRAGIIHRDLKVENLLLDHNMDIKVIDFGLSNEEFVVDDMGSEVHCRTQCGSPAYAAPELLGQKEYSNAVDVWSIGVNMYAMLTGCLPFTVEPFNITALHAKMLQNKINPIPDHISHDCKDLLKQLLVANPEHRIKRDEIFAHPWLNHGQALVMQPAPYPNRLTSDDLDEDIIDHMVHGLKLAQTAEIKHDLLTNRANSHYAIYHLLVARLARYNKEFKPKVRPKKDTPRKRVSKDMGFFEDEDDVSSVVSAPTRPLHRSGGKRRSSSMSMRHHPVRKPRPVSDDFSEKVPITSHRRLSGISEERQRRKSLPSEVLQSDLTQFHRLRQDPHRRVTPPGRPQYHGTFPHSFQQQAKVNPAVVRGMTEHSSPMRGMSPPPDPLEIDVPRTISESHKANQLVLSTVAAWQSNPPSRASSRTNVHAPRHRNSSHFADSDDDPLEFHEVSSASGGASFQESPEPKDTDFHLPSLIDSSPFKSHAKKSSGERRRRNGYTNHIGNTYQLHTELTVAGMVSELLRVAHNMRMKIAECRGASTIHCFHRSITFEIDVRRERSFTCSLHFEWLSGGSHREYSDLCQEIVHNIRV